MQTESYRCSGIRSTSRCATKGDGCIMQCMEKHFTLSLPDFCYLSILCVHCKTRLVLDLRQSKDDQTKPTIFPEKCSACGSEYDRQMQPCLTDFRRAYQLLLNNYADRLSFHGILAEDGPAKN